MHHLINQNSKVKMPKVMRPKTNVRAEVVPIVPGRSGNTKQISPAKHWCFTLNNWTQEELEDLRKISSNSSIVRKYAYQSEIGGDDEENAGTPHIQGYIEFAKKKRPFSVFENRRYHWEKKKGTIQQAAAYCQKEYTYTGEFRETNMRFDKPLKLITDLYPWQQKIVNICKEEPDDRTIHWFWEPTGKVGKSSLIKYLVVHFEAIMAGGKAADMKYFIAKHKEKKGWYPTVVIMDVPRKMEGYISWGGIEEIKNGCYLSTKFDCEMVVMNSPHLIIFANFLPDTSVMSSDRWNIVKIET